MNTLNWKVNVGHCLLALGLSSCTMAIVIWLVAFRLREEYLLVEKVAAGVGTYLGGLFGLIIISYMSFFLGRLFTRNNIICLYIALIMSSGLAVISWRANLSESHLSSIIVNIGSGVICLVGYFSIFLLLKKLCRPPSE